MVTLRSIAVATAATLALAAPALAQKAAIAKVHSFEVNGIHVITCPAYNQVVSVVVGIEGGLASGETDNPELADFTADLVTSSGSAKYPKDALRQFLSETSTRLSGSGDYRGITYSMTTTKPNFERGWDVLASLITAPAFDKVAFDNTMQRRIAGVKRRWSNPEAYASIIADSLMKRGNPVLSHSVSLSDVEHVDIQGMRQFLQRISERSRMLIVVVGNVSQSEVRSKVATLAKLPAGTYKRPTLPPIAPAAAPDIEIVNRPSPTTYVQCAFAGPPAATPEYWSLQIGMLHLRNVLFEELRTKRNLTYAPGAYVRNTLGQSNGVVSVSSTLPDSSIVIMYRELEKMKQGEFGADELNDAKQVFTTSFYMHEMTNEGIASSIYSAQRNAGDWHAAFSLDAINAVDKAGVKAVFDKYAQNLQVGIVGKEQGVTRNKYLFTE